MVAPCLLDILFYVSLSCKEIPNNVNLQHTVNGLNLDQFLNWIIGSVGLPDPILELIQVLNGNSEWPPDLEEEESTCSFLIKLSKTMNFLASCNSCLAIVLYILLYSRRLLSTMPVHVRLLFIFTRHSWILPVTSHLLSSSGFFCYFSPFFYLP